MTEINEDLKTIFIVFVLFNLHKKLDTWLNTYYLMAVIRLSLQSNGIDPFINLSIQIIVS